MDHLCSTAYSYSHITQYVATNVNNRQCRKDVLIDWIENRLDDWSWESRSSLSDCSSSNLKKLHQQTKRIPIIELCVHMSNVVTRSSCTLFGIWINTFKFSGMLFSFHFSRISRETRSIRSSSPRMWNETYHSRWRLFHACRFQSIWFVWKASIDRSRSCLFLAHHSQFQSDQHDMKDFKFARYLTKEKVRSSCTHR